MLDDHYEDHYELESSRYAVKKTKEELEAEARAANEDAACGFIVAISVLLGIGYIIIHFLVKWW